MVNTLLKCTLIAILFAVASCGKNGGSLSELIEDEETITDNRGDGDSVDRLHFEISDYEVIDDIEGLPATKTSIDNAGHLIWTANDTVGIYPDTGSQIYFSMVSGSETSGSTQFSGGGWAFKTGSTYYSYYPFIGDIYLDRHHVPVHFMGQKQTGTTGVDHIGQYDYMYAPGTGAERDNNGDQVISFHYIHLCCIIRTNLTLPAGTWTKLAITAQGSVFVAEGYHDLMSDNHAIVPTQTSSQIQIDLENITLAGSTTFYVYILAAPVNLRGQQITVSVRNDEGKEYECKKTPSYEYTAGKIWGLTCASWTEAPMSLIIDDWGDGGSISGTAE